MCFYGGYHTSIVSQFIFGSYGVRDLQFFKFTFMFCAGCSFGSSKGPPV
jgi:hypothetical protein